MPETTYKFSSVELWVQDVLRVPPNPEPPEGSPDSIQVFHAGRNYLKLCLLGWFMSHVFVLAMFVAVQMAVSRSVRTMPDWGVIVWRVVELLAVLAFAMSAVFTYFSQRLNYALRWYMITDRSLRIRSGVVGVQEMTMTFSNIQEIRVTAGPIQNLLKIADVEVQSAGGGSDKKGGGGGHVGRFKGVSNANDIRDLIVERLRQYRDSGLGEHAAPHVATADQAIEAAQQVLVEARALRERLA